MIHHSHDPRGRSRIRDRVTTLSQLQTLALIFVVVLGNDHIHVHEDCHNLVLLCEVADCVVVCHSLPAPSYRLRPLKKLWLTVVLVDHLVLVLECLCTVPVVMISVLAVLVSCPAPCQGVSGCETLNCDCSDYYWASHPTVCVRTQARVYLKAERPWE